MPGSDATFAQAWTQFGLVAKIFNEFEKFGNANSANILDMIDAATTGIDGEYSPRSLEVLRNQVRRPTAGTISPGVLRAAFKPMLLEMGRIAGVPEMAKGREPDDITLLRRIRQYMIDQGPVTINVSGQTLDSSFTTAGTGNGTWAIMHVDKDAEHYTEFGDIITFECIRDQLSGANEHEEVWEARGTDQGDALLIGGAGYLGTLTTLHAKSANLLKNASFDNGTHTDNTALAATTSVTNWVATTAANWKSQTAAAANYRDYPSAPSTTYGLENTADDAITQTILTASKGARFDPYVPHVAWVRWKRLNSATGTLTLTLGSQTATATIGSATNDQWNTLLIPASATDTKAYYDNWVQQDATFAISTTTLATGTIYIDDCGLAPMTRLGSLYYAYIGGSTPALRGATSAVTHADGTRGINAYWLWRAYGSEGWLPTDGTPTYADPS